MLGGVPIEVTGTAIVTRKGLRRARRGWPWLQAEDVVRYEGDGGPFVDLVDETSLPMGTAVYDPHGPAPIRLLSSARTRDPVGLLHTRLERALARREADLDSSDAARLCHGEADGTPGIIVDRFGPGLLVTVEAAPMAVVVDALLPLLVERTGASTVVVVQRDEARLQRGDDTHVRFVHGRLELAIDLGGPAARRLTADLERQRALRRWARGRCLDLAAGFCGFGLQLAEAGASEVVFVDDPRLLSRTLVEDARHNQIETRLERVESDPLAWLRAEAEGHRAAHGHFDVVVFHPRPIDDDFEIALPRATEHGTMCLRLLDEGGILAISAGSTRLDDDALATALQDAAAKSRKRLQVLARLGAGPDHPTLAGMRAPPSLLVMRVLATA